MEILISWARSQIILTIRYRHNRTTEVYGEIIACVSLIRWTGRASCIRNMVARNGMIIATLMGL